MFSSNFSIGSVDSKISSPTQLPSQEELVEFVKDRFFNRYDKLLIQPSSGNNIFQSVVESEMELNAYIEAHIHGAHTDEYAQRIGVSSLSQQNTCKWICIDLDGGDDHGSGLKDPEAVLTEIHSNCQKHNVPVHIELSRSCSGYHVWFFFPEPIDGVTARKFGYSLCPKEVELKSGEVITVATDTRFELFPKNDVNSVNGNSAPMFLPWNHQTQNGGTLFHRFDENGELNVIEEQITEFETVDLPLVQQLADSFKYPQPVKKSVPQPTAKKVSSHINTFQRSPIQKRILEKLDLNDVYGEYLTGSPSGEWLKCRNPKSATGDRNPSAVVADGSGQYEKGTFKSFGPPFTNHMPVFDFLIWTGQAADFKESLHILADKAGVELNQNDCLIEEMNREYAVADRSIIIHEYFDPERNRQVVDYVKESDIKLLYRNEKVKDEETNKTVSLADYWLGHKNRRTYKKIIFDPGNDHSDYFNLWRGFSVEPIKGDCSLFLDHIKHNICNHDEKLYEYVISWMANGIQNPGKQAETALVLRGGRGTGKGFFAHTYGSLFGDHYLQITQSRHLVGNFNSHLKHTSFLFADEAFWAGDKQGENVLKGLITEPTILIEPKGKDALQVLNRLHIVIASNDDWVVPAGRDERRFFIVDVSNAKQQDREYFSAIKKQLDNGGREALLHFLQNYEITIDLRDVPQTEALLDQKIRSLDPVGKFWYECLMEGELHPEFEGWMNQIPKDALYEYFKDESKASGIRNICRNNAFTSKLKEYCSSVDETKTISNISTDFSKRKNHYIFPSLEQCRKEFEQSVRMEIQWPCEYEDDCESDHEEPTFSNVVNL